MRNYLFRLILLATVTWAADKSRNRASKVDNLSIPGIGWLFSMNYWMSASNTVSSLLAEDSASIAVGQAATTRSRQEQALPLLAKMQHEMGSGAPQNKPADPESISEQPTPNDALNHGPTKTPKKKVRLRIQTTSSYKYNIDGFRVAIGERLPSEDQGDSESSGGGNDASSSTSGNGEEDGIYLLNMSGTYCEVQTDEKQVRVFGGVNDEKDTIVTIRVDDCGRARPRCEITLKPIVDDTADWKSQRHSFAVWWSIPDPWTTENGVAGIKWKSMNNRLEGSYDIFVHRDLD